MYTKKCPICSSFINEKQLSIEEDIYQIKCPTCGKYKITPEAEMGLGNKSQRYILSGITRRMFENGNYITLKSTNLQQLIETAPLPESPFEKFELILKYVNYKTSEFGKYVKINVNNDYPICFAKGKDEFINLLSFLIGDLKWIENPGNGKYRITLEGWKHLTSLPKIPAMSNQAFVAMSFSEELNKAWEKGFYHALKETGYKPVRVDKEEHNEKICDIILKFIRNSGLLIADFTENKGGVYFEAGFALGLGIPVIWTCRKDDIDKLHFDTRQYNHIVWENNDDLKKKLINRIEALGLSKRKK